MPVRLTASLTSDGARAGGAGGGWATSWGEVMGGACGFVVSTGGFLEVDNCEVAGGECGAFVEGEGSKASVQRCACMRGMRPTEASPRKSTRHRP